jgi:hypothetical protein
MAMNRAVDGVLLDQIEHDWIFVVIKNCGKDARDQLERGATSDICEGNRPRSIRCDLRT